MPYRSNLVHEVNRDVQTTMMAVAYTPFDLKADDIFLIDELRESNKQLLNKLLENKQLEILPLPRPHSMPKSQKGVAVHKTKKLKKRKLRETKKKPAAKALTTSIKESSSSPSFEMSLDDLVKSESAELEKELIEEPICDLSLPTHSEPSSLCNPIVEETHSLPRLTESSSFSSTSSSSSFLGASSSSGFSEASSSCGPLARQDELDNVSFVNKWLAEIINESKSRDEAFGVFQKASRLTSMLNKNAELLEQTQEATAGLAIQLQKLKQRSIEKSLFHTVPQRLESDFLYFMDTPTHYLKGLRFGFVNTLFENLGIKIDKSMAGSRMHFSFKDKRGHYETSIHLHDKHNGTLEGGRISSLRKFLIDCGFIYGEI